MEDRPMVSQVSRMTLVALLLMVIGIPTVAAADTDTVLQVVAVEVEPGELDEYVKRVSKFNAIAERLGVQAKLRIWQATAAGPNTGIVAVAVEYPSLSEWVRAGDKLDPDKEWQKIMASLPDIRKIVSSSLYQELAP